jgi:WD40 repeat protein
MTASIGVFNFSSRILVREIGMTPWAESAAWSPNGRELAVSGDDMALWPDGDDGRLSTLPTSNLSGAAWLPDGQAILNTHYGSPILYRRKAEHWSRSSLAMELGASFRNTAAVALSPNGERMAGTPAVSDQQKRGIAVWDLATSKRLFTSEPLGAFVYALAWSPDGETLAVGSDQGGSALIDAGTGKRLAGLPHPERLIQSLAFSPSGKAIAAGYSDGVIRLCDAVGQLVRELVCERGPGFPAPGINALNWSADGRRLQALDPFAIYLFDASTGELLAKAPTIDRLHARSQLANFSPDGRYLAVATTCTRIWDCAPLVGGPKAEGQSPKSEAKTQYLSNGLPLVASIMHLGHGQAVVVSSDGHWLGTRQAEKELVYVIKTADGQETLSPREFYKRFGWRNDPSKVVLP